MIDTVLEEILEEIAEVDPVCSTCGGTMATVRQWRNASLEERQELLEDGILQPSPGGACHECHKADIKERFAQRTPEQRAERRDRT